MQELHVYSSKNRQDEETGRSGRIRTYDPLVPNQMRYQAALHPDGAVILTSFLKIEPEKRD